jgi:hypothetical protein
VKLILQIAAGIVLGVAVIAAANYSYNWYRNRSTASEAEWDAMRVLMDTTIETCPIIRGSAGCASYYIEECQNLHINSHDCSRMVKEETQKVKSRLKK